LLQKSIDQIDQILTPTQSNILDAFDLYTKELKQWNRTHNLTGYKSDEIIERYIVDSLYPLSFLPPLKSALDIGTGAGFPGLILAIAMPQTEWTLVEPLHKRASFLQFIKARLSLENVTVCNDRVENLDEMPYELITSRAVSKTETLLSYSAPFRDSGTILLFYKGEKIEDELPDELDCKIIELKERNFLLIDPTKRCRCY